MLAPCTTNLGVFFKETSYYNTETNKKRIHLVFFFSFNHDWFEPEDFRLWTVVRKLCYLDINVNRCAKETKPSSLNKNSVLCDVLSVNLTVLQMMFAIRFYFHL